LDLLAHRYGAAILDTDIEIGIELIPEAYKKQLDDKLWQRWLVDYARMDNAHFIGFEEYKKKLIKPIQSKEATESKPKTKQEIYAQADRIISAWKKGGGR
jgi:hypothetical protein